MVFLHRRSFGSGHVSLAPLILLLSFSMNVTIVMISNRCFIKPYNPSKVRPPASCPGRRSQIDVAAPLESDTRI
ncbi:hypothetical protein EDC01DRAFT_653721 [Geopyxis carbonaria]|nr:hypothetical protein EDC01DRAFT_653721 [Geopyxis carbonaria]